MNQVRCNWCVPIVLLSIWYNVCTYHSPVGHYIVIVACVIFIPGFTPGKSNILVSIWYTVYTYHILHVVGIESEYFPQYHYIIVTFLYLVYCIIVVCVEVL